MRRFLGVLLLLSCVPFARPDTEDSAVFRGRMLPDNEVPALNIPGASADYTFTVRVTRDSRGVITLDLPVTGSLDDPAFRLGPVVWQMAGTTVGRIASAPFSCGRLRRTARIRATSSRIRYGLVT